MSAFTRKNKDPKSRRIAAILHRARARGKRVAERRLPSGRTYWVRVKAGAVRRLGYDRPPGGLL